MLARAALVRRARQLGTRAAPTASTLNDSWRQPPKPPAGTLEKLADAVRLAVLKGARAAPLVSLAPMATASSGGGAEGIGEAMTGLAMVGAAAVAGGAAALALTDEAAPDVASPLGEQPLDLGPVLGTVAAMAPGGLHESNSLDLPYFVTGGTQRSLKEKLYRFYGKTDEYTFDPQLVKNVEACYDDCEKLLGLITYDPVVSVAKNIFNVTDPAHGLLGAGSRSSAFNAMRTLHHISRGAANEAGLYEEAAEVHRLITDIKARGGFTDYQASVEFLLLANSMYLVHGTSDAHAKILSAVPLNARCAFAFFNAKVRLGEEISDKAHLVEFLEERGRSIADEVVSAFRKHTADDQKVKVLAFAQTGAEELPLDHADFDKRCVPRLNATVAEVDGATLRLHHDNAGRFADHAFHAWWGNNFHFALGEHLLGKGRTSQEPTKPKPEPDPPLPPNPKPDPDDEDDRYAVWMGCTICYIFLTDQLYDQLSEKLLAPHYSLDLNDKEVGELIYKAYKECEVVGDVEFLEDSYFAGKDFFDCPKTWA